MSRFHVSLLLSLSTVSAVTLGKPRAPLYGIAAKGATAQLVKVNTVTGNLSSVGHGAQNELNAQGLAAIDQHRGIYYVLDFNDTSRAPQLIGFDLKSKKGEVKVDITLDLSELAFVGVGQSVAVDPLTGRVLIAGHDSTVQGHHIFWIDPFSTTPSKPHTITKIAAPPVYLLGGTCALDWDAKMFYAMLVLPPVHEGLTKRGKWPHPYNTTKIPRVWLSPHGEIKLSAPDYYLAAGIGAPPPPPPPPPPFSVSLVGISISGAEVGKWSRISMPADKQLGTLAYDETKKQIVGFGSVKNADGTFSKTLNAFAHSKEGYKFKVIGKVSGFAGEMGPITTVDSVSRVHYSLLAPPPKPWKSSNGCAATGFPCAKNTSCCAMPPSGPACFNVPSCADMHGAPDVNAPFYLAQLSLDDAVEVSKAPPICSIGANNCPWSLEADEIQTY